MEWWHKKVWSWCLKTKSLVSSARLLWVMVPLVVMLGIVILRGSPVSNPVFALGNHPTMWRWPFSSLSSSTTFSSNATTALSLDVVGDPVNSGIFNHSMETNKSEIQKEKMRSITMNTTHVTSALNEISAPPSRPRIKSKFSNLERIEARMQQARLAIKRDTNGKKSYDPDYIPTGPMYWNSHAFHRSYLEMEKQFKIYVYEEGEPPIFHYGPCRSTYATEGNFISFMEQTKFRTRDPDKAHVYFLPFSVVELVRFVFTRNYDSKSSEPMRLTMRDYINLVAGKYPYWNRSLGADHLMLSCHDWGPKLSFSIPPLYKNSIRALCNANTSERFNPSKDVSIPEILLHEYTIEGLIGGPPPSQRTTLAFFAGGVHGPIRPLLFEHWENKDEDIQLHRYLPKGVSYYGLMRKSKFCICASGLEAASPRLVEALYTGCVPVLMKEHYVSPFSDVLNWKTFSVEVSIKDIPNLKKILTRISTEQYLEMQRRGQQMRRHFELNGPPKRYDVFHMFLHSVWLRRLNVRLHGAEEL